MSRTSSGSSTSGPASSASVCQSLALLVSSSLSHGCHTRRGQRQQQHQREQARLSRAPGRARRDGAGPRAGRPRPAAARPPAAEGRRDRHVEDDVLAPSRSARGSPAIRRSARPAPRSTRPRSCRASTSTPSGPTSRKRRSGSSGPVSTTTSPPAWGVRRCRGASTTVRLLLRNSDTATASPRATLPDEQHGTDEQPPRGGRPSLRAGLRDRVEGDRARPRRR